MQTLLMKFYLGQIKNLHFTKNQMDSQESNKWKFNHTSPRRIVLAGNNDGLDFWKYVQKTCTLFPTNKAMTRDSTSSNNSTLPVLVPQTSTDTNYAPIALIPTNGMAPHQSLLCRIHKNIKDNQCHLNFKGIRKRHKRTPSNIAMDTITSKIMGKIHMDISTPVCTLCQRTLGSHPTWLNRAVDCQNPKQINWWSHQDGH